MKYSFMTYTIARQIQDSKIDMVQMCKLARELGFDAMDQVYLYGYDANEVKRIADDNGVKIICYTFHVDINVMQKQARMAALDQFKTELDNAHDLGVSLIMLPLMGKSAFTREESRQNCIFSLKEMVKMGNEAGIQVTIEHFPGHLSPFITSSDMKEALAEIPDIRITFDSGNMLTGMESPVDAFKNTANEIVHAHFKDFIPVHAGSGGRISLDGTEYEPALIGEGIIDYPSLIKVMQEFGYDGYVNIEYEGDKYKAPEATKMALDYLRSVEKSLETVKV